MFSPCQPCCLNHTVTFYVVNRCFNPGEVNPNKGGLGASAKVTATMGKITLTGNTGMAIPIQQAGTYTVTFDVTSGISTGMSFTATYDIEFSTVVNIVETYNIDRYSTAGCSCFCDPPVTLNMISANPSCNYQMFQSCTLTYGPPPPAMVEFGYTSDIFTSETFNDSLTNDDFFYYFWCQYNQFFLTRVFPVSPFGSPYRDGILYTWIVGGNGNNCKPFSLQSGTPFPGSDLTCSVTITG